MVFWPKDNSMAFGLMAPAVTGVNVFEIGIIRLNASVSKYWLINCSINGTKRVYLLMDLKLLIPLFVSIWKYVLSERFTIA